MQILSYDFMSVEAFRLTEKPLEVVGLAASHTMARDPKITQATKLVKFILDSDHTSVVEHVSMTLLIKNVSRSFLAQITRHRMASYTSSSQHYQDYRDYPACVSPDMAKDPNVKLYFEQIMAMYQNLCRVYPHHEARQILPNAMAVNIEWTLNARSLINFLNLRLCKRNTLEMLTFAKRVHVIAKNWFPELFNYVHADCAMKGYCTQGRMSCGEPYEKVG